MDEWMDSYEWRVDVAVDSVALAGLRTYCTGGNIYVKNDDINDWLSLIA